MTTVKKHSSIYIGTSGWSYDDWRGRFYPPDVAKTNWLPWYAEQFATSEINGSFYRTPSEDAVRAWRERTPAGFRFAWKASKFITHWKRLRDTCANSIELMTSRLELLGPKCGPVLFQLPARFEAAEDRLATFFKMLPRKYRYAFEFRHPTWYRESVYDLLRDHDAALCISDHHHAPAPWVVTAGHVYVRGHGPGGRYKGSYRSEVLRTWARRIRGFRRKKKSVYVYFDNDQKGGAPKDAKRLSALIGSANEVTRRP